MKLIYFISQKNHNDRCRHAEGDQWRFVTRRNLIHLWSAETLDMRFYVKSNDRTIYQKNALTVADKWFILRKTRKRCSFILLPSWTYCLHELVSSIFNWQRAGQNMLPTYYLLAEWEFVNLIGTKLYWYQV